MKIIEIRGREILDSRGNPTVEAELITDNGIFRASVPSGASRGIYEAFELRDKDNRYKGKGVLKAVENINKIISKKLKGFDVTLQKEIDQEMIKLDGTENKKNLGANAILAVSMAVCRAGAKAKNLPLYKYIQGLSKSKKLTTPIPSFNIINGGRHAGNNLSFQEFMIIPIKAPNFKEALRYGVEIYHNLKEIIEKKYGKSAINVGDEGGFTPNIKNIKEVLDLLEKVIEISGYKNKVKIGIDVAASEFYHSSSKKYNLNFKDNNPNFKTSLEMIELYKEIIEKYDICFIEDPFDQNDLESYQKFNSIVGKKIQIIGDDLLVTNPKRIKIAIEKKACNSLLLKINQIGTVSEAIEAANLAKKENWKIMVSHRSGETNDDFIADFAVGINADQIKAGAPCRGERVAKYNQLLRIEEEIK